jgi:tetratricopeptide (TPR) repeat protein
LRIDTRKAYGMRPGRLGWLALLALVFGALAFPCAALAQNEIDLGVITVKDKALAADIRAQLLKGANFETLAKKYSVAPTASRGGRLGRVPAKRLRVEFRQALRGLAANQPSKVVPTEGGYNILMRFATQEPKAAAKPVSPLRRPQIAYRAPDRAPAPAPVPAIPSDSEEKFLLARQQTMAGMESLVANKFDAAQKNFSQSRGLNPQDSATPFFQEMTLEAAAGKVSAKAVSTFAEGFIAMTQGEAKQAAGLFAKAAEMDGKLWQAKLFQANMVAGLGQMDQAQALLKEVLAQKPKTALAYVSLGMLVRDQGQLDEARNYFNQALKINPDMAEAHYSLGGLALYKGDLKEAEHQYRATIAADPFNEEAYSDLGLTLATQGKVKEAEKQYKKALELNPNYASAHLNLGNLYAHTKRYNQAIDEFNKALAVDPGLLDAHSNLAATYVLKEDWPRAIQHADIALKANYPVPAAILRRIEPHRKKAKKQ